MKHLMIKQENMSGYVQNNIVRLPLAALFGLALVTALPGEIKGSATPEQTGVTQPGSDPSIGAPKPGEYAEFFLARHAAFLAQSAAGPIGVVFMGDSISEGWKRHPEIWTGSFGVWSPANFGIGGDRTQQVIWRIENGELDASRAKVVVVMIGTNNTNRNTGPQIVAANRKIIGLIHERLPQARIVLCALLPRGPRVDRGVPEQWEQRMAVIRETNPGLRAIAEADPLVEWLDMTEAFSTSDGLARGELLTDWLHLNADGYRLWANQLVPILKRLMEEN